MNKIFFLIAFSFLLLFPVGIPNAFAGVLPFIEHDFFEESQATLILTFPDTTTEQVDLSGPLQMDVVFETGEGDAQDDDANGLDEVETEIVSMSLTGTSSLGAVEVDLIPNIAQTGTMEEKVNNNPGTLDVPPFAASGGVNVWSDLSLQVTIDGQVLLTQEPLNTHGMMDHKPSCADLTSDNTVALMDQEANPTGISIRTGSVFLQCPVFVEHDHFEESSLTFSLHNPDDSTERIRTSGQTWMDVFFEPGEGEAQDNDSNGLDEVPTEIIQMDLVGSSPLIGPIRTNLLPSVPSDGFIEENSNNNPGTLDVPPFGTGIASMMQNMFLEFDFGGIVLHTEVPIPLRGTITHKPMDCADTLAFADSIPLVDRVGNPTEYRVSNVVFNGCGGFIEHDHFTNAKYEFELIKPDSSSEEITTTGPLSMDVFFEVLEGRALDDNSNGLDEVQTEIISMSLSGSSTLGPVTVDQTVVTGQIEEKTNNTPGVLDLNPFASGDANMWQSALLEINVDGTVLHNSAPQQLHGMISHKPADCREALESSTVIPLFDAANNPTGFSLGVSKLTPNDCGAIEIDIFSEIGLWLNVVLPDSSTGMIDVSGPAEMNVFFENEEGDAQDDDSDGLGEVEVEIVSLSLVGASPLGPASLQLSGTTSEGIIEEKINNTPGTLDVDPFMPGDADMNFDLFFEADLGGQVLHNEEPLSFAGMISTKPMSCEDSLTSDDSVELFDESGNPTGILITSATFMPCNEPKEDTDGDGLSDDDEINIYRTDPFDPDTDGGGSSDGEEVDDGTDPLNPNDDRTSQPVGGKMIPLDKSALLLAGVQSSLFLIVPFVLSGAVIAAFKLRSRQH